LIDSHERMLEDIETADFVTTINVLSPHPREPWRQQ
jgi:hypothetical protein